MQILFLHNTDTEEIVGEVMPVGRVDFDYFRDEVRKSFISFHKSDEFNDGDYSIEDFVEWHNENNVLKIDWILTDFIQLCNDDIN